MSEPWHGRPERAPADSRGQEFPNPPFATRPSASSAHHRATAGTGEWWGSAADRPLPQQPAVRRARRLDASRWHWLLLVPIVIPLIPGLYNRMEPTLFGLPFFFWSQLGFAFLSSAVITLVHLKVR